MENASADNRDWLQKRSWFKKHADWRAAITRQQRYSYYEEELKLKLFQEREADLYDEAVAKYGMSRGTDTEVAKQLLGPARRQAEAASEILRRRGRLAAVPDSGCAMYFAWQLAYSDYLSWATAQLAAVSAVANGMAPHPHRVQKLLSHSQKSRRKAEGEERKFVRKLKLAADEVRKMLVKASMAVATENWQPQGQPMNELESLRQRVTMLEASPTQSNQAKRES